MLAESSARRGTLAVHSLNLFSRVRSDAKGCSESQLVISVELWMEGVLFLLIFVSC